ncbi:extensin family protein [Bradyrhizobium sp.]|uniref:extensin family protein n=1 Tax=Bradyrhizobium sp. TaxID=376 RepID=UPI003C6F967F
MKSSAGKGRRKWASRRGRARRAAMVTVATLLFACGQTHFAAAKLKVPLPRPRPAEAPSAVVEPPTAPEVKNAEPPAAPAPALSACRLALTEAIAIAPSIPDIHGTGGCGGEDLVRLEVVVLPDNRQVTVKPAAILRCKMASAIADWVRSDIATLAKGLGSAIAGLDNFDSFECRGRNRIVGAQLSEHGRANALDVRSFKFSDGRTISLTDRNVARDVRETVLHSVCARFSTVLGPGSDGYHEDHIHLDLMERRNDYRICQWNVWDPLPAVAPMLPAPRPEEAPPRAVANEPEAKPNGGEADPALEQPAEKSSDNPPTKKRR